MESLWTARLRSFYGGEGNAQKCVITTFGGRSTVVKSSFGGTILVMIQMPFFFLKTLFWGEGWRVRIFCGFVVLKGHPGGC